MKHIKPYQIFENSQEPQQHPGFPETEEEIHILCEEYKINYYTINDDLSINVDGLVNLNGTWLDFFPVNFNYVSGNFYCYGIGLKSLKGSPKKVSGFFNCSENNLTSLEYAPNIVGDYFDCGGNSLVSLKGCPESIKGSFFCNNNELISLKGCPESIKGSFSCSYNKLKTLEYISKGIHFNNTLTSFNNNPIYTIVNTFIKKENAEDLLQEFNDYDIVRGDKVVLSRLEVFINDFYLDMPNLDEVKKHYTIA